MEALEQEVTRAALQVAFFDPSTYGFPVSVVPLLPYRPQLSLCGNSRKNSTALPANKALYRSFSRGRYALGEAYRLAGLGPGTTLLAPAYHCITMLDPAIALAADISLYPMTADLSPDMTRLDDLFCTCRSPVKALLATHFFGLAKDFSGLKSWCEKRNIVLIEDCSHALFTEDYQTPGTGIFGEYITASPYKFFPCEDGGLLFAKEEKQLENVKTHTPGFINELRGLKRFSQRYRTGSRQPESRGLLDSRLAEFTSLRMKPGSVRRKSYGQPSQSYRASDAHRSALASSRYLIKLSSADIIAQHRKNNYRHWLEATADLPNCHALYTDLPETCAPYMFPLYIEYPDPHFIWLKKLGVPIWRWDEMAESDCAISKKYQYHLLHLPCHQSLGKEQMAWLFSTVRKVMQQPTGDKV